MGHWGLSSATQAEKSLASYKVLPEVGISKELVAFILIDSAVAVFLWTATGKKAPGESFSSLGSWVCDQVDLFFPFFFD